MEHQYSDRIVRLLQLYLLGDITEEERQELEDWCEEAPRNRKLFEQICQEDLFSKERYVYEKIHDTKAFSVFEKRVRKVCGRYHQDCATYWYSAGDHRRGIRRPAGRA